MNKQQFIEKSNINILDLFIENPKGEFQHKGKWYSSKFGCDLIDHLVDISNSALSECWDMAGEEGEKNEYRALEERDNAEDWAEQLANDISAVTGIDIGEHSNMNNPWANALEALHTYFDSLTSQKEEKA